MKCLNYFFKQVMQATLFSHLFIDTLIIYILVWKGSYNSQKYNFRLFCCY